MQLDNVHSDHFRRILRDSDRLQQESMPVFGDAIHRFLDRDDRTDDETSSVLLGGLTRRSLFRVGGITIAGAALLAACGSDKNSALSTPSSSTVATSTPDTSTPTTSPTASSSDIVLLRTASSIEQLAIAAYQMGIDSGLVTTKAIADTAKLFQDHHRQHADFFQSTTKNLGGTPFTQPNPVVLAQLQPAIKALKDEQGVVRLALMLERAAAATYQAGVGTVTDLTLNTALMSVGGVEARHAAALASALGDVPVPAAFGPVEAAITAGTGV